jgi:multidrug transporter EmrE-like cation transporter
MKEPTPQLSMILILLAAVFGALGSFLYKTGATHATESGTGGLSLMTEPRILGGVGCYLAVMVLFIAAFKNGGALSVLYPLYAATFIFGALIAMVAFGTPIRPINMAGMGMLIVGMHLMGR